MKWEYAYAMLSPTAGTVTNHHTLNDVRDAMNRMGRDGWEVMSVEIINNIHFIWFKRQYVG